MTDYESIQTLEPLDGIRQAPEMYIGTTEHPTHLFHEVIDNSLDEANSGNASLIEVKYEDGFLSVIDNGRGFPQGIDPKFNEYYVILCCTKVHSGGKFNKDSYKISIGMHGIGLTACNALSDRIEIKTIREGRLMHVNFEHGVPEVPGFMPAFSRGSVVSLWPSKKYFASLKWDDKLINSRVRLAVTFIKGLRIIVNGIEAKPYTIQEMIGSFDDKPFIIKAETDEGESAEAYFAYDLSRINSELTNGSVNLLEVNHGAHIRMLERAIVAGWQANLSKEDATYLQPSDYTLGLKGFILVKLEKPTYSGQTKGVLAGRVSKFPKLFAALTKEITAELKRRHNEKFTDTLIRRFRDYRKSLNHLSSTEYINDILKFGEADGVINRSLSLESNLIDCNSTYREGTELIICEGESAGRGMHRDPARHAVLPLRGKTLNVVDKELHKILQNPAIRSLVNAMGCGVRKLEDPARLRYGKIIIAADADVDGKNIAALLIGALVYLTPKTVAAGKVYVAHCPLFGQYGKPPKGGFTPVWDESELKPNVHFMRFKGLGTMDESELALVLLDEKIRRLSQIVLDDAQSVINIVGHSGYKKELLINRGVLQ